MYYKISIDHNGVNKIIFDSILMHNDNDGIGYIRYENKTMLTEKGILHIGSNGRICFSYDIFYLSMDILSKKISGTTTIYNCNSAGKDIDITITKNDDI